MREGGEGEEKEREKKKEETHGEENDEEETAERQRRAEMPAGDEDAFHSVREKGEMRRVDAYRSYFRIDLDIADVFSWTML